MTTITDTHKKLLEMFVAPSDETREQMRSPWNHGNYVAATDGHAAIRIPGHCDAFPNDSDFQSKYGRGLNLELVYDSIPRAKNPALYSTADFEHAISGLPLTLRLELAAGYCKKCIGSGETTCSMCKSDIECDECDGTGIGEKPVEPNEHVIDPKSAVLIAGAVFQWKIAQRLYACIKELNAPTFTLITESASDRAHVFGIDEIHVLLCPIRAIYSTPSATVKIPSMPTEVAAGTEVQS